MRVICTLFAVGTGATALATPAFFAETVVGLHYSHVQYVSSTAADQVISSGGPLSLYPDTVTTGADFATGTRIDARSGLGVTGTWPSLAPGSASWSINNFAEADRATNSFKGKATLDVTKAEHLQNGYLIANGNSSLADSFTTAAGAPTSLRFDLDLHGTSYGPALQGYAQWVLDYGAYDTVTGTWNMSGEVVSDYFTGDHAASLLATGLSSSTNYLFKLTLVAQSQLYLTEGVTNGSYSIGSLFQNTGFIRRVAASQAGSEYGVSWASGHNYSDPVPEPMTLGAVTLTLLTIANRRRRVRSIPCG